MIDENTLFVEGVSKLRKGRKDAACSSLLLGGGGPQIGSLLYFDTPTTKAFVPFLPF